MKKNVTENYLEKRPVHSAELTWSVDESGNITLDMENKGLVNKIAQKLLKKPKISHIHLDELGSYVWPLIDGERSIIDIGVLVKEHFGEKAEPLYERLAKFFQVLESCHFIEWKINDSIT